jgi:hypothetical protein
MPDTVENENPAPKSIQPRLPYFAPVLVVHGTIQQLTQLLPGSTPTDGDEFNPGSSLP